MVKLELIHPQEVEAHYILPAIRAALAFEMKNQGREQREIAKLLGVSEAAVSQYLSGERGGEVKLTKKARRAIAETARKLRSKEEFLLEAQSLLKLMLKERITCKIHEKLAEVPKGCNVCFQN